MYALRSMGIKEDWRIIYFYEDEGNSDIWRLKQGIDDLGYVEKNRPSNDIEKPFCELIKWMEYKGYKGVILNQNKTSNNPKDFYFKGIYSISNFLCDMAKRYCTVRIKDVNTGTYSF